MDEGPPMFAPLGWLKGPGAKRIYRTVADSALFDPTWYRHTHMARADLLRDPLWHYLDRGWKSGCDPSPLFDTSHYVAHNRDVRGSGLNPLFHYIEYGRAERRSPLSSPRQTFDSFFPDGHNLRVFETPQVGADRLTVVLDRETMARTDTTLPALLRGVMSVAKEKDRRVRILCWLESHVDALAIAMDAAEAHSITADRIEWIPAIRTAVGPTFGVYPGEHFFSTSWTSARSLRHVAPSARVWAGVPRELAGGLEGFIPQAKDTWEHWAWSARPSLPGFLAEQKTALRSPTEPITSPAGTAQTQPGKIHVGIFADPARLPLAYLHALRVLENVVLKNSGWAQHLRVSLHGDHIEPVAIAGILVPQRCGSPPAREKCDVALVATDNGSVAEALHAEPQGSGGRPVLRDDRLAGPDFPGKSLTEQSLTEALARAVRAQKKGEPKTPRSEASK